MENVQLKLETDYEKYGNSTGEQIGTLSIAVYGQDYNGLMDGNMEHIFEAERYALGNYDYETEFLAQITPAKAGEYITDKEAQEQDFAEFKEALRDKARDGELDDNHPLAIELQKAHDDADDSMNREWLYGDRSEPGLIREAGRKYSVKFDYDQKADVLTFDIEDDEVAELVECDGIENTPEAVGAYIASKIEGDAYHQREKEKERRAEARENYARRKAIEAERRAKDEAERIEKLKAIIG